ncbi:uncharacterized protein LOC131945979 [Physella acuta]|uniref:uncharacterized protein LOC131945979 n=1 Tax=Physella acuta TaxID=109671 RepID=UPI0027DCC80D|nr:uncharacterized protein LOC131945979 [Physella acuta]
MDNTLGIGAHFDSFDAFQTALQQYEDTHFVQFARSSSQTVAKAQASALIKTFNPKLTFAKVCYTCIFGPKKEPSTSTGLRASNSRKLDCPVRLRLGATKDGQQLVIKESVLDIHNHEISEELYKSFSRQKRLDKETEIEVFHFINSQVDKRLARMVIREKIRKETGKSLSLKDILNIEYRVGKNLKCKIEPGLCTATSPIDCTVQPEDENNAVDRIHQAQGECNGTYKGSKKAGKYRSRKIIPRVKLPYCQTELITNFNGSGDAAENGVDLHSYKNNVNIMSIQDIEELEAQHIPSIIVSEKCVNQLTEAPKAKKRKLCAHCCEGTSSKELVDTANKKLAIKKELLEVEKQKLKVFQKMVKKLDLILEKLN